MRTPRTDSPDPLSPIRTLTIGVVGYGNQGRAQSMNLRDAGLSPLIGARSGGPSAARAGSDGFEVHEAGDLAERCDLVCILVPDPAIGGVLASLRESRRIRTVVLAHGYALRFGDLPLRDDWDVILVAPSGPGTALRREDRPGRIPALIAVHRDRSGAAWEKARAYAEGAGCSPSGLLATTVAQETEVDLFGEQVVLCGGLAALVSAAWETLVERGYDPRVAYMECVHQISLTAEMITRFGIAGMRERISSLALFGDLTRGPRVIDPNVRARMADILDEIRTGRFAADWDKEVREGFHQSRTMLDESRGQPIEDAGREIRRLSAGTDDTTS